MNLQVSVKMHLIFQFLVTLCALCVYVEALEEAASKQLYSFTLDDKGFSSGGSLQKSPAEQSAQYYIQENASSYAPQGGKYKNQGSASKQPPKNKYYGSSNSKPSKNFKPNTRTSIIYGRKFAESLGLLR